MARKEGTEPVHLMGPGLFCSKRWQKPLPEIQARLQNASWNGFNPFLTSPNHKNNLKRLNKLNFRYLLIFDSEVEIKNAVVIYLKYAYSNITEFYFCS